MTIFRNPIKYIGRKRIRHILRGHNTLKAKGKLAEITIIKNNISDAVSIMDPVEASGYIFHDALNNADTSVRQYLLTRVGGISLNRSILSAMGNSPVPIHIVPPHIRNILKSHNIPISMAASSIAWNGYIFAIWCYGILQILKSLYKFLPAINNQEKLVRQETIYFTDLLPGNLPSKVKQSKSFDLLTWYMNWHERPVGIKNIAHGINIRSTVNTDQFTIYHGLPPIPEFNSWKQWSCFAAWSSIAIIRSFIDWLRGRWWHPFLLAEATKAHVAKLHDKSDLYKAYWFPHTRYVYRPLWTYTAEQKGSEINLYFYSVNNNAIQKVGTKDIALGPWHLMTWPNYIAWNEKQKQRLQESVGKNVNIQVIDDLPFCDSDKSIPKFDGEAVAIFDIQPLRPSRHAIIAQVYEYYCAKNCIDFIKDIKFASIENGLNILWKRKRELSDFAHPKYVYEFKDVASDVTNFISIDPSIAAHRVINEAKLVISMPYTSTALIGKNLGKPSCFYDPTGLLDPEDKAANGVSIIQGREALRDWVRNNR